MRSGVSFTGRIKDRKRKTGQAGRVTRRFSLSLQWLKRQSKNRTVPMVVSPLTGGAVRKLFSTHPPIEERIERLERMARR